MTDEVEKLLEQLDDVNDKIAETRSFVTSLTLELGAARQNVTEWEHFATLEVLEKLGGYKQGDPVNAINEKVLGSNAETRARTLFLEMERIYANEPEGTDVDMYYNYRIRQQETERDLAVMQDKLRKLEDMAQAIRWKLRVHIAEKVADIPISREMLTF